MTIKKDFYYIIRWCYDHPELKSSKYLMFQYTKFLILTCEKYANANFPAEYKIFLEVLAKEEKKEIENYDWLTLYHITIWLNELGAYCGADGVTENSLRFFMWQKMVTEFICDKKYDSIEQFETVISQFYGHDMYDMIIHHEFTKSNNNFNDIMSATQREYNWFYYKQKTYWNYDSDMCVEYIRWRKDQGLDNLTIKVAEIRFPEKWYPRPPAYYEQLKNYNEHEKVMLLTEKIRLENERLEAEKIRLENEKFRLEMEENQSASALDSFSIFYEHDFFLFNFLYIGIALNFFLIIFFFYMIQSINIKILNSFYIFFYSSYILNFFFNIFKTLIESIRSQRYFIFIISLFIYILFQNLGGFFLLEVSLNTYAIITLFLSFIIFFNFFINVLINYNEKTYIKFVQKKLKILLVVILFIIELVSYFVRPFSLGVRLFANILSGHILMHIFFNALLFIYKLFFFLSIILLLFCIFILIMELFVSFVQSYIFFILCVIYLKDVYKLH